MSNLANGQHILNEFRAFVARQTWSDEQLSALISAEGAIEDIIAGRMDSSKLTAREAIAMKEMGLL